MFLVLLFTSSKHRHLMAKKDHRNLNSAPNPNAVPNRLVVFKLSSSTQSLNPPWACISFRDVIQRLNFLHQAAHYLATASGRSPDQSPWDSSKNYTRKRSSKVSFPDNDTHSGRATRRRLDPVGAVTHSPMSALSRVMSTSMKAVAKKAVLRMYALACLSTWTSADLRCLRDPSVKRTICQSCDLLLVPGHTALTRLQRGLYNFPRAWENICDNLFVYFSFQGTRPSDLHHLSRVPSSSYCPSTTWTFLRIQFKTGSVQRKTVTGSS